MNARRKLHYWQAITAARAEGFDAYAAALVTLYRQEFPND